MLIAQIKSGFKALTERFRKERRKPYKGKLDDLIRREDAVKAVCKFACCPGPLCPDMYCYEVRMIFDDIDAVEGEKNES